jgi:ACS family tartrate transporter-like MFS transporter
MLVSGWNSDRTGERYLHLAIPLALMALSYVALAATNNPVMVMIAYLAAVTANGGIAAVFWLAPGELIHPRDAAVSIAAINAIGQFGSFLSPYAWGLSKDLTGSFHAGVMALPVPYLIAAGIVLVLRGQALKRRATAAAGIVS